AALVPLTLLLGYGVKLWRRVAPLFAREADRPRVLYRAALDRLSEDGLRRRWGESPESFAARCAAALPALRPLTDAHLAAAFGRRVDETRWSRMIEDGRELRAQLGRAVPWWRRWLGALNPY